MTLLGRVDSSKGAGNYTEGVLVHDALFVAHDGAVTLQPDNPTRLLNGDFEDAAEDSCCAWAIGTASARLCCAF